MNYLPINDNKVKQHLLKLIDFLFENVINEGGDGDALWYSRFYDVKDIFILVQEYNNKLKFPWKVELDETTIHWYDNQEAVVITNDEKTYNEWPSWGIIVVKN